MNNYVKKRVFKNISEEQLNDFYNQVVEVLKLKGETRTLRRESIDDYYKTGHTPEWVANVLSDIDRIWTEVKIERSKFPNRSYSIMIPEHFQ